MKTIALLILIFTMILTAQESRPRLKPKPGPTVAIAGHCAVTLVRDDVLVDGARLTSSRYAGLTYWFPDERRKRIFDANPAVFMAGLDERYSLAKQGFGLGGICPVFLAEEGKVMRGLRFFTVEHMGRRYRCANEHALAKFKKKPDFYAEVSIEAYREITGGEAPIVKSLRPNPSRLPMRRSLRRK